MCSPEKLLQTFRTFLQLTEVIVQDSINHSWKCGTELATLVECYKEALKLIHS